MVLRGSVMVVLDEVLVLHAATASREVTGRLRSLEHWEWSRESFWDWGMKWNGKERNRILDTAGVAGVTLRLPTSLLMEMSLFRSTGEQGIDQCRRFEREASAFCFASIR